jgi:hypothetical protein
LAAHNEPYRVPEAAARALEALLIIQADHAGEAAAVRENGHQNFRGPIEHSKP